MKRTLAFLLILLLLPAAALANVWGLKGDLLTAVMADHTWDDYTTMADQVGNVAAMTSRYHNALMLVTGKKSPLRVYTRALWQPDDEQGSATLTSVTDGFSLSYRDSGDSFRFCLMEDQYVLTIGGAGELTYAQRADDPHYYDVTDGTHAGFWYGGHNGLSLDRFSIRLMPRTWEELVRLKTMLAALDSGRDVLGWWEDAATPGRLYTPGKKGTVPVYGAPSTKAWRAGKGKASVSLNGDIYVLREWVVDGEVWLHIRYEVSQRTHRFGFIRASDLPGYQIVGSDVYADISVPVRAAVDTWLTDDPLVSQFAQANVPAGTQMSCIGVFDDMYALVQTKIDGKAAWLFVPLKDIEPVPGTVLTDVMAQLDGCWEYWAGGSMGPDYLRLNADGTFCNPAWPEDGGTWIVTAYDPAQGKYWNDPPYEIAFFYNDGRTNVKGLTVGEQEDTGDGVLRDSFSLTNWEGGGGYIRIDEEDVILWEHADGNG